MKRHLPLLLITALMALASVAGGRPSPRCEGGFCPRVEPQKPAPEPETDMAAIHRLMADHKAVRRTVTRRRDGVEATTESDDPKVAARIQAHVAAMKARLEKKQPIRAWDPLFATLFQHADRIAMSVESTKKGVRIVETSADAYTVQLIQAHAGAVDGFVKGGMDAMPTRHPAPKRP